MKKYGPLYKWIHIHLQKQKELFQKHNELVQQEQLEKCQKVWCVVESYYKHGDVKLHTFLNDSDLKKFFINKYGANKETELLDIIHVILSVGEQTMANQSGWAVKEIRCIDLKNKTVESY